MNKKFKCVSILQDESGFSVSLQIDVTGEATPSTFGAISFSRLTKVEASQFVIGNYYELKPITA